MEDVRFFVYRLHPARPEILSVGPTPEEAAVISEHFNYLKRLFEHGVVLHVGRTLTTHAGTWGLVVLRADSEDAARAIMENDPGVRHGVHRAELFPYRLVLGAPT